MRKHLIPLFAALACLTVLTACHVSINGGEQRLKPSDNIVTREYAQPAFDRLDLSVVARVRFVQSQESKVVVKAPDNYIGLVQVDNKNGRLALSHGQKRHVNIDTKHINITVYSPALKELRNSGVSNVAVARLTTETLTVDNSGVGGVKMADLKAKTVRVDNSGVGSMTLSGTTDELYLDCSGAGNVDAQALKARAVTADVSGVGSVKCHATEYIGCDVSGVGSLKYAGSPAKKDLQRSGVGRIGEL